MGEAAMRCMAERACSVRGSPGAEKELDMIDFHHFVDRHGIANQRDLQNARRAIVQ